MDVIINPTNKCNFKCSFCAASNMHKATLSFKDTVLILDKYKKDITRLIINGGDPLVMSPHYYEKLIKWTEDITDHYIDISITTNLWDYYLHPNKWINIFKHHRIWVMTSFQYKGRYHKLGETIKPFTEKEFVEAITRFKDDIGYVPQFIYVVDNDTEDKIMDALKLADELNTKCKMNKIMSSGRASDTYYPRYRMFEKYAEIIKEGYMYTETNCHTTILYGMTNAEMTCCDMDTKCYKNIRCINPDKSVTSCCYIGQNINDDNRNKYDISINDDNDISFKKKYPYIKEECSFCSNYRICNSCSVYIKEVRDNHDEEKYCYQMKKIVPILRKLVNDNMKKE